MQGGGHLGSQFQGVGEGGVRGGVTRGGGGVGFQGGVTAKYKVQGGGGGCTLARARHSSPLNISIRITMYSVGSS